MSVDVSHAVRRLLEARRTGTQIVPPFALPDRTAVHAIQDGVAAAFGPVDGWKTGARSPTAEPNAAPLLAGTLRASPARFDGKVLHMIGVEIEIAFRLARALPPRGTPVGRDEALAAVGDAFVGMEVVDTRIADFQTADPEWLLADNQMNHALVAGDPVPGWRTLDWPSLRVRLEIDGRTELEQQGGLAAVDPLRPLAWMIDHAVRQRGGLRPGQVITTGSWTGLRYYPPGTQARGTFDGLGSVAASF